MPSATSRITTGQSEWIPVSELHIGKEVSYQRLIRDHWVDTIAENFDPDQLGVIEVTKRLDGTYWVRDGAHRVSAMRKLGYTDRQVLCHVQLHSTIAAEARSARQLNKNLKPWMAYDLYRAGLIEGDPVAQGIRTMTEELGIHISPGASQDMVSDGGLLFAIGTAMTLYRRDGGPELLRRTLKVLSGAWPSEAHSYESTVINGLASFLAHHEEYAEDDRLIAVLKRTTPDQLRDEARTLKRSYKWGLASYVASAIEGAYNLNRARNRLREVGAATYAMAIKDYERRHRPIVVEATR